MARFTSRFALVLPVAAAMLSASVAHASGQLPPTPIEPRTFASFAACRAFLDATFADDLRKADPKPLAEQEGGTRQTLVDSKGVVVVNPGHATYEVEEGWQFRVPLPEERLIRTSYSYDRRALACDGRRLTGTSTKGYHSQGFAPLPADGKIPS